MDARLTPAECEGYNSTRKYKLMQCGMGPKQKLQLLYPGRFLEQDYNYDGSNIPNENMEGLEKTRKISQALRTAYDMEKEALSRHLGGKNRIFPLPAVEPDAIINDPRLSGVSLEFGGESPPNSTQNGNLENEYRKIVDDYRQKIESPTFEPSNIYDWMKDYEEIYPSVNNWSEGTVNETEKDNFVEHFEFPVDETANGGKNILFTFIFLMLGLIIIFIILLSCQ